MKPHFIIASLLALASTPALAASTDWFLTDGGQIRLVTAADSGSTGPLRGVLEIQLKPGWKTYWVDPGDAGIPPQIDIGASRNVNDARFFFPAPKRFDDGYAVWAGYKDRVALALEFETGTAPLIEAEVFLGICEKICIPVQTSFSLDPDSANDTESDRKLVVRAFETLPKPAEDAFGLASLNRSGEKQVMARFQVPDRQGDETLFVVSAEGWYFGTPVLATGGEAFDIPVLAKPKNQTGPAEIEYTLISGDEAVSGKITISP